MQTYRLLLSLRHGDHAPIDDPYNGIVQHATTESPPLLASCGCRVIESVPVVPIPEHQRS